MIRCLQVDDKQGAVLGCGCTHISCDIKMVLERLLLLYAAIIHMSDAFQSMGSGGFLKPVHDIIVCFLMAADQLDFVSRSS